MRGTIVTVKAGGVREALYLVERTPAWLSKKSKVPLRRVLKLQRQAACDRIRNSDVRAVRAVLRVAGVRLVTENAQVSDTDASPS